MKKGFTLIELLAVIAVLAIVLLIAVPNIISVINDVKTNALVKDDRMLANATKNYLSANQMLIPNAIGDMVEISLNTLQTNKYITTIKDPYTNADCNGYVMVIKTTQGYDYIPHLKCGTQNTIGDSTADGVILNYKFDDFAEPTTNLIPNGKINAYPTIGNTHGTYNTNQYNSNVYFSIGTIADITNNIVTLSVVDHPIYTYDVLTPQTSGGGLTAGTNYFIKKISANSFSVHAYNSSADGSIGFSAYDSITNDIRIPINITSFPTMFYGPAHLPNSSLIKEIIPNCYASSGVLHECIRLNTKHKLQGSVDGMAYGVYPVVEAGKTYTFSFYYRAVDSSSFGSTISLGLYTGASWVGSSVQKTITSTDWKRYEMTVVAPNSGGTNLYFWPSSNAQIEISEIQCEQKNYATPFVLNTSTSIVLDYANNSNSATLSVATTPKWVENGRKNTGAYEFDGATQYINVGNDSDYDLSSVGTIMIWAKPDTSYPSSTASNAYKGLIAKTTNGGLGQQNYYIDWYGSNTTRILRGSIGDATGENIVSVSNFDFNASWVHIALTWNGTNVILYTNGKEKSQITQTKNAQITTSNLEIGRVFNNNGNNWDGLLDEVRIYNRALSSSEIAEIYNIENGR